MFDFKKFCHRNQQHNFLLLFLISSVVLQGAFRSHWPLRLYFLSIKLGFQELYCIKIEINEIIYSLIIYEPLSVSAQMCV